MMGNRIINANSASLYICIYDFGVISKRLPMHRRLDHAWLVRSLPRSVIIIFDFHFGTCFGVVGLSVIVFNKVLICDFRIP